ncbi:hypothetical protein DW084_04425 [Enterococcus casseliflavus]|uniref:Uncharacterized protein n=1 Tax=Enterococcus casseliflavus TaxID=37734 RepID=A0A415EW20_ENTCA|nr:hypothetical protein DW084_04425 [Enterococcus casseliflavus]
MIQHQTSNRNLLIQRRSCVCTESEGFYCYSKRSFSTKIPRPFTAPIEIRGQQLVSFYQQTPLLNNLPFFTEFTLCKQDSLLKIKKMVFLFYQAIKY